MAGHTAEIGRDTVSKQQFHKRICVKIDGAENEQFLSVIGRPERVDQLDAEDGDLVAVYELVEVKRFATNPQLARTR